MSKSIPGPQSRRLIRELHRWESPHVTYTDPAFPIFIRKAKGCKVWDADGNSFLDFTSFFGVSSLGHAPEALRRVMTRAIRDGWHSMGDVHPHVLKVEASRALAAVLPASLRTLYFSCNGSDAVETAMKTAFLYTGKPGVLSFEGAYHGLGYGAMQVTHRAFFREPFVRQSKDFVTFAPFVTAGSLTWPKIDAAIDHIRKEIRRKKIGCVIIEPIQGRGGQRTADVYFLRKLAEVTRAEGAVLVFDEIFCGMGRTGRWFALEHSGVVPDLLCLGKGMANGFPISVCAGTRRVMDAWGPSEGEARHTSTFLGHPVGCAMIVATVNAMKTGRIPERARKMGAFFESELRKLAAKHPAKVGGVRGKGMMLGLEISSGGGAGRLMKAALRHGLLVLPSGSKSEVLSLNPPLTISRAEILQGLRIIDKSLREI